MAKPKVELTLPGQEKFVDAYVARQHKLDDLQVKQTEAEALLSADARQCRIDAEKRQQFFKSVHVLGKATNGICVVFCNRFGEIETSNAPLLATFLGSGEIFSQTFEHSLKMKPKFPLTLARLEVLLGPEAFEKLTSVVELHPYLAPTKEIMEKRFAMRPLVDDGTNEKIDQLIEHVQAKPSVKVVK